MIGVVRDIAGALLFVLRTADHVLAQGSIDNALREVENTRSRKELIALIEARTPQPHIERAG